MLAICIVCKHFCKEKDLNEPQYTYFSTTRHLSKILCLKYSQLCLKWNLKWIAPHKLVLTKRLVVTITSIYIPCTGTFLITFHKNNTLYLRIAQCNAKWDTSPILLRNAYFTTDAYLIERKWYLKDWHLHLYCLAHKVIFTYATALYACWLLLICRYYKCLFK